MEDAKTNVTLTHTRVSILVFALFFSWLLSVTFQGQVLYALAAYHRTSLQGYIVLILFAHFAGLLLCGVFVRSAHAAKILILGTVIVCLLSSALFFLTPGLAWTLALFLCAFLAGACVAAWGFFIPGGIDRKGRVKLIADCLIFSNLLMIVFNTAAVYISAHFGLLLSMLSLLAAFIFALRLPSQGDSVMPARQRVTKPAQRLFKPLLLLCLFIAVITINSGLMYAVQAPAFSHLQGLTVWYWAVPYIAAIFLMRNMKRAISRSYFLYAAMAMIGFSYIAFVLLDRSVLSYLIIDTLMLGACGIFDLFWWSILVEMTDFGYNPAGILGIGLSSNVLGVLIGGVAGDTVLSGSGLDMNSALLALGIVCAALILLPILHRQLDRLLRHHVFRAANDAAADKQQQTTYREYPAPDGLTGRESEITALLMKGHTYRAIADELHVSENTVRTHIKNIYAKCGVRSRAELMNRLLNPSANNISDTNA